MAFERVLRSGRSDKREKKSEPRNMPGQGMNGPFAWVYQMWAGVGVDLQGSEVPMCRYGGRVKAVVPLSCSLSDLSGELHHQGCRHYFFVSTNGRLDLPAIRRNPIQARRVR